MASLLTELQRNAFTDLARQMIKENRPSSAIRIALGKKFDLNPTQVKNQLWRAQIKLSNSHPKARVLSDLSEDERAEILQAAKDKIAEGMSGDDIRALLCEKYDVSERTVSAYCKRFDVDVRSAHSIRNAKDYGTDGMNSVPGIKLEDADYDPEQDIFRKAAQKLIDKKKDVRFDAKQDQWWLDGRPVSRIQLAQSAGMGC